MFPAFFSTSEVLVFLELIKTWEYHLKEVLVTGETTEQGACPTAAVRGWPGRYVRQSSLRGKAGRGGGARSPGLWAPALPAQATGFRSRRFPAGEEAGVPPGRGREVRGSWCFSCHPESTPRGRDLGISQTTCADRTLGSAVSQPHGVSSISRKSSLLKGSPELNYSWLLL